MFNYLIIRTSWLYEMHGMSFAESMVEKSYKMKEVKVPNDIFGKLTYTMDLAKMTRDIIDRESRIYHPPMMVFVHCMSFPVLLSEMLCRVAVIAIVQKVKCPKHSILANTKTNPLRHWTIALPDYLSKRRQLR